MRLFAARTAIDVHPKLILCTKEKLTRELQGSKDGPNVIDPPSVPVSDARMRQLVSQCRTDPELVQNLLYEPKYDDKWKNCYTDVFLVDEGKKIVKPYNRQGWVVPLKNICDSVGMSSNFFTENRSITLKEARAQVLRSPRLALYNEQTYADRDRVRVAGKYYNNIQLGKRMFGPSKKQKFVCSITGGMERRFEILDNQVNYLPFKHDAFDQNLDKCRNRRVKCRDSSRVVLRYPPSSENTFIHANYVRGGPLFNTFIVTQAPMENTIGDFWRMVWQEKAPYIFMLIGRKEKDRCAEYWPRRPECSSIDVDGLHIHNVGISSSRDPVFRVTYIRILDDYGEEHPIQKAIHFLRLQRPFSVETPMQFIFVHRCVQKFFSSISGRVRGMEEDYHKWLTERAGRMFVDNLDAPVPGYRLLSPRVDPDLLRLVRRPPRPNVRREAPDCVGELPIPLNPSSVLSHARRSLVDI
ncbi:unnamed protein product [Nippostrongylus brasiliensis]|uniref:Tyrosine-protein phosphatase domain-containing protein n=1 Tax=Nippostrongylus brasiliensis TaxID=27835 RepID=A0A158QZ20_NIPBR|nr:unnamed protein product [Nippostrongylus brasiliensis]